MYLELAGKIVIFLLCFICGVLRTFLSLYLTQHKKAADVKLVQLFIVTASLVVLMEFVAGFLLTYALFKILKQISLIPGAELKRGPLIAQLFILIVHFAALIACIYIITRCSLDINADTIRKQNNARMFMGTSTLLSQLAMIVFFKMIV